MEGRITEINERQATYNESNQLYNVLHVCTIFCSSILVYGHLNFCLILIKYETDISFAILWV